MDNDFADWYRPCTTGTEANLTGDLLAKRWEGVTKLAEGAEIHALDFVRLALQRRPAQTSATDACRAAFKAADPAFQMSGNDLELSVLAGAVLCRIMSEESDAADAAALGLVCAVSVSPPHPPWAGPFVARAAAYLDSRLRELRKQAEVRGPTLPQKKLAAGFEAFAARLAENQPAQNADAARKLAEVLLQALASVTEVAAEAIAELDRQSDLRREETDILWWLFSATSRDLKISFKEAKTLAASLVAGKELADLVRPPGVLPARSLLLGIIPPLSGRNASKGIGLIAAVNATDRAWRQGVADRHRLDLVADLCPLLAAVRQSLTTDGEDEWTAAYKKASGIGPGALFQPADLALQMHRECLLARLASEE